MNRQPRIIGVALLALVLLGAIRQDEVHCEEASLRIGDCCPGIEPHELDCDYREGSCEQEPDPTLLTVEQSKCIRELDCETLVERGACDAIASAIEERKQNFTSQPPPIDLEACQ